MARKKRAMQNYQRERFKSGPRPVAHPCAERFAVHNGTLDIAFTLEIENENRHGIFHALADGCHVHHLQPVAEDLLVG